MGVESIAHKKKKKKKEKQRGGEKNKRKKESRTQLVKRANVHGIAIFLLLQNCRGKEAEVVHTARNADLRQADGTRSQAR